MASDALSPALSPVQLAASRKQNYPPVPKVCAVTGGTGFVGARLVEMLVERGAQTVRCLDIVPPPAGAWRHPRIEYVVGDICDAATVARFVAGADCVWHNAAAVGPFHPTELYFKVNYEGTLNVLSACREAGVRKIVMSSSPSTRFDGKDVDGLTEAQMPVLPQQRYLQTYAETKAMGEKALTDACCDELMTCAVAPHQVYGPRDNLFLPNLLESAGTGRLRVFGPGTNRICFTHVDNYAHGLIIAERALYAGSPVLGNFYIVTDGDTHPYSEVGWSPARVRDPLRGAALLCTGHRASHASPRLHNLALSCTTCRAAAFAGLPAILGGHGRGHRCHGLPLTQAEAASADVAAHDAGVHLRGHPFLFGCNAQAQLLQREDADHAPMVQHRGCRERFGVQARRELQRRLGGHAQVVLRKLVARLRRESRHDWARDKHTGKNRHPGCRHGAVQKGNLMSRSV